MYFHLGVGLVCEAAADGDDDVVAAAAAAERAACFAACAAARRAAGGDMVVVTPEGGESVSRRELYCFPLMMEDQSPRYKEISPSTVARECCSPVFLVSSALVMPT